MIILSHEECPQGSEKWHQERCGLATASRFGSILAESSERKMRNTYMRELAGEIISGEPTESYNNHHMERGKVMEDEARDAYALVHDADIIRAGFVKDEAMRVGCSPDSFVGEDGMVEIKTMFPAYLVEIISKGEFPRKFLAQCAGALWITGRRWIDIVCYWPTMPMFVKRLEAGTPETAFYISHLKTEVTKFWTEVDTLVARVRQYGERG